MSWHTEQQRKVKKQPIEALRFTINDCMEAIAANPDNPKCGQYQDEIHYAAAELRRREAA